jgi:hypothetical protein
MSAVINLALRIHNGLVPPEKKGDYKNYIRDTELFLTSSLSLGWSRSTFTEIAFFFTKKNLY